MSRRLWIRILLITVQLTGCGLGGGVLDADLTSDASRTKPTAMEIQSGPRQLQENLDSALTCSL